ncbi:MAG TPA: hypothetical protein PKK05_21250 [Leptospiraceae bacterium]|nr:hypothetical protein [Leptospiraceae bacterium]
MRNPLIKYECDIFRTDEKYISHYELEKRVMVNIAYFGSGKTQSVINHIKRTGQKIVFVHPTRALISDCISRLRQAGIEIKSHLELNQESALFDYDGNLEITLESLSKIDFSKYKDALFVFDEFVSIMNQMYSGYNSDRVQDMAKVLKHIFQNCKVCVFDSLIQSFEIDFIYALSGENPGADIEILSNEFLTIKKRPLFRTEDKGFFEKNLIEAVKSGARILFLTDDKSYSEFITSQIEDSAEVDTDSGTVSILSRDTRSELLDGRTIADFIREKKPKLLSVTPTGFVGLDIPEGSFDMVYMYGGNFGIRDYRIYIQALHRLRDYSAPAVFYSNKGTYDPMLLTSADSILVKRAESNNKLNDKIFYDLGKDGFWKPKEEYSAFENLSAELEAYQNRTAKIGLAQYISDFFSERFGFETSVLREKSESLERPSLKERTEEKKNRLKAVKLIDKQEYDSLRRNQAGRDLNKEETALVQKYEIAEKFSIGHTDIQRNEKVNLIIDYTANPDKMRVIAENFEWLKNSDSVNYEKEKADYEKTSGIGQTAKSKTLETMLLKKILSSLDGKEFGKTDIPMSLIYELETVTGRQFTASYNDAILDRKCFADLKGRLQYDALALDYAKSISEGDENIIREVFKSDIMKIFDAEMGKLDKRKKRIQSRSQNPGVIQKHEEEASKKAAEAIRKRVSKFIQSKRNDFAVSPLSILSDWLSNYGISLEKGRKSGSANERKYSLNLSLFHTLTSFRGTESL